MNGTSFVGAAEVEVWTVTQVMKASCNRDIGRTKDLYDITVAGRLASMLHDQYLY